MIYARDSDSSSILTKTFSTKYDASSADIAPLGSISKTDAKAFQAWAITNMDLPIMDEFINATPSAELLPLSAGVQDDESDAESKPCADHSLLSSEANISTVGFTYSELSELGGKFLVQHALSSIQMANPREWCKLMSQMLTSY